MKYATALATIAALAAGTVTANEILANGATNAATAGATDPAPSNGNDAAGAPEDAGTVDQIRNMLGVGKDDYTTEDDGVSSSDQAEQEEQENQANDTRDPTQQSVAGGAALGSTQQPGVGEAALDSAQQQPGFEAGAVGTVATQEQPGDGEAALDTTQEQDGVEAGADGTVATDGILEEGFSEAAAQLPADGSEVPVHMEVGSAAIDRAAIATGPLKRRQVEEVEEEDTSDSSSDNETEDEAEFDQSTQEAINRQDEIDARAALEKEESHEEAGPVSDEAFGEEVEGVEEGEGVEEATEDPFEEEEEDDEDSDSESEDEDQDEDEFETDASDGEGNFESAEEF